MRTTQPLLAARHAATVSFDEISVLLRIVPYSRMFQQILISYINLIDMEVFTLFRTGPSCNDPCRN